MIYESNLPPYLKCWKTFFEIIEMIKNNHTNYVQNICYSQSQCSMGDQKVRSPVCANDCQGYFNECQMKQESCLQGLLATSMSVR